MNSGRNRKGYWIGMTLAFLISCLSVQAEPRTPAGRGGAPENEVKAAFLYNFARFVDWPKEIADDPTLVIAVLGDGAMADAVVHLVEGKAINKRKILVERIYDISDARRCHILFVGPSEDRRLEEVFAVVAQLPILTVGETDRFSRLGGMIRFDIIDARLRFEINLDAVRDPGLIISSRLLDLASAVRGATLEAGLR